MIKFINVLYDIFLGTKNGLINNNKVDGIYEKTDTYVNNHGEIPSPYLLKSHSTYKVVKTFKFLKTLLVIK